MNDAWRAWLPMYREAILRSAAEHQIEPVKLAALIYQESNGGMRLVPDQGVIYHPRFLYRYEPAFWTRYLAGKPEWAPPPGCEAGLGLEMWKRRVSASYGIVQVMYSTAVELAGERDFEPEGLLDPSWCLDLACRHIRRSIAGNWTWRGALARYNTGRATPEATQYDDEVIAKEEALVAGGALDLLG